MDSWSHQNSIICWTLSGGDRPLFTNYCLSKLTPLSLTKSLNYEVAVGRLWTCQVTDGRQPYSVSVSLYLPSSFLHSLTRQLDGFWNWCRCALMVHVYLWRPMCMYNLYFIAYFFEYVNNLIQIRLMQKTFSYSPLVVSQGACLLVTGGYHMNCNAKRICEKH